MSLSFWIGQGETTANKWHWETIGLRGDHWVATTSQPTLPHKAAGRRRRQDICGELQVHEVGSVVRQTLGENGLKMLRVLVDSPDLHVCKTFRQSVGSIAACKQVSKRAPLLTGVCW